jgi:ubiquinol-cytochrome c reductase iron-sulfur subunit
MNRRDMLFTATAAMGAAGILVATWPLIDQMNPDARVRAAGDILEVNLDGLRPAQPVVLRWHEFPIFVARRTAATLDDMREARFIAMLIDPNSEKRQQPSYARNWHRSIDPAFAVLVGVCTSCGCVPQYLAEASPPDFAGGYVCPCCATHYDPAGRAYSGLARYNLPVPPYSIAQQSRILIGKGAAGDLFSLKSVEQI